MTIATREEAHKTIRLIIICAAILLALFAQSLWLRDYLQRRHLECPTALDACEERLDELRINVCRTVGRCT